jgi:glycosyltransferase involved in cell wall biosynthesis
VDNEKCGMRSLRVAFLAPEFVTEMVGEGGLASYLNKMTKALMGQGHEVEVFTLSDRTPERMQWEGMMVHRVGPVETFPMRVGRKLMEWVPGLALAKSVGALRAANGLARALESRESERPFDLVQSSDYGAAGLMVARRPWRRHIVRCSWAADLFMETDLRGMDRDHRTLSALERWSIRRAQGAYAPSRCIAEHFQRRFGMKVGVVRPPFVLEANGEASPPDNMPDRFLLHFGRLGRRKGTDLVMAALLRALEIEPSITMVWAGKPQDPAEIEGLLKQLGEKRSQVVVMGPVPKPRLFAMMKQARAAVLPSRVDNLPNASIECLEHGLGVITMRGASIDELVEDGKSGALVDRGDVMGLANAMVKAWRGEVNWVGDGFVRPGILEWMKPGKAVEELLRFAGME